MQRLVAALALVATCSACATAGPHSEEPRRRDGQTIISTVDPAIRVSVDRELPFLGETEGVVMNGRATAHQYWFADIDGGQLQRAVIVHFERMNQGATGAFNYPTFRMEQVGAQQYLHQTFPVPDCALFTDRVRDLLQSRGAEARPACVMTRYVRAVTEDKRAELILFYLESVGSVEEQPEGMAPGGIPTAADTPWGEVDARLTRAFHALVRVEG